MNITLELHAEHVINDSAGTLLRQDGIDGPQATEQARAWLDTYTVQLPGFEFYAFIDGIAQSIWRKIPDGAVGYHPVAYNPELLYPPYPVVVYPGEWTHRNDDRKVETILWGRDVVDFARAEAWAAERLRNGVTRVVLTDNYGLVAAWGLNPDYQPVLVARGPRRR